METENEGSSPFWVTKIKFKNEKNRRILGLKNKPKYHETLQKINES